MSTSLRVSIIDLDVSLLTRVTEREPFYCVEGGGVGDGCDVECEHDGSGQQAWIYWGRA